MSIKSKKFNFGKMEVIDNDVLTTIEFLSIKSKDKKRKAFVGISSAVLLGSVIADNITSKNINHTNDVEVSQSVETQEEVKTEIVKVVEAKLLSAVNTTDKYDVKSAENTLTYTVEKGSNVFTPVSGVVSEVNKDSVTIDNKDLNIKMIINNVYSKNLKVKDKVTEGSLVGNSSKESFNINLEFLDIEKEKIEYKLSVSEEDSANFNYTNAILKGQERITSVNTDSEVASIIGNVSQDVLNSDVLKGVKLENKNQAYLLKSSEIYYSNEKLPISILKGGKSNVSSEIRNLEPIVKEVLGELNIADFSEAYLAILQHESGGKISNTGGDVAQASQSANGKIGGINDVRESIKAGAQAFKRALESNNAFNSYENSSDARYIPQTYNFGSSLGKDVVENNVIYNVAFVQEKAKEYRKNAENSGIQLYDMGSREWRGNANYGDFTYVSKFFNIFTPENVDKKIAEAKSTIKESNLSKVSIYELESNKDNQNVPKDVQDVSKDNLDKDGKYISEAVVEGSEAFKVKFNDSELYLSEINLNKLNKDNADSILNELLETGNYKNVKNEMLETLLKALDNKEMNKFLNGDYDGKVLDTLVEMKDGIIGNRDLTNNEKLFIKAKTEGSYSIETADGENFVTDNKSAIEYALNDDKERIDNISKTYSNITLEAPKGISLKGLKIALDYGHALKAGKQGGIDIGASTVFKNGKNENKLTFEWGKEFKNVLESYGATVIEISPDGSHDLARGSRGTFANKSGADLFFSIHFNAGSEGDFTVSGTEAVISTENTPIDRSLAETILKYQSQALPDSNKRPIVQKEVGALINADMKYGAVIVEPEFLVSVYGNIISENENAKKSVFNSWIKGISEHIINNGFGAEIIEEDKEKEIKEETKVENEVETETDFVKIESDADSKEAVKKENIDESKEEIKEEIKVESENDSKNN